MSLGVHKVIPVVPAYHPSPPSERHEEESRHTHITNSLDSVGQVWLVAHAMPDHAYPSLPRVIPAPLAHAGMDAERDPLVPPPDGMLMHPSPMRLAPFIVDQQAGVPADEVFTPTPTKQLFKESQSLGVPDVRPEGLKARKDSSTLGLVIEDLNTPEVTLEDVEEDVIQTAKHASPSKAHMLRLSPLSPKTNKEDLLDSPDSPTTKQKLSTPLLPRIKVQLDDQVAGDEPRSPFEAYSPLIATLPRDACATQLRQEHEASEHRTSHEGETDQSREGPGVTPSLAEIMDRVGVTAQRNRLDCHD